MALDDESYAIALPKGSEDLQVELNKILETLQKKARLTELQEKNTKLANDQAK